MLVGIDDSVSSIVSVCVVQDFLKQYSIIVECPHSQVPKPLHLDLGGPAVVNQSRCLILSVVDWSEKKQQVRS